jgi:hypothetical protein
MDEPAGQSPSASSGRARRGRITQANQVEMAMPDRRQTAASLERLAQLIERMDNLGVAAEDAAARVTEALAQTLSTADNRADLTTAIGDVIDIVTERSHLAHEAHRLIVAIRSRNSDGWMDSSTEPE